MIAISKALGCAIAVAASAIVLAQSSPTATVDSLLDAVRRELQRASIPGASFAVASQGEIQSSEYGFADRQRGEAVVSGTLMQIGSLNKLMTALALSATLEQQQIALSDALGNHVTGLPTRLGAVTFHQLLSHTSGLRDVAGQNGTTSETALAARVRAITDADFVLPPGTVFSYSNLGYAVAGFALEQLRQRPFADALHDAILKPLSMGGATMRPPIPGKQVAATGHRLENGTAVAIRDREIDTSIWPAGYLWASGRDLHAVLRVLAGTNEGNTYGLPAVVFERATTPHAPMPNVFVGGHYGYGLMLGEDRGTRIYEHGGTQRGFSSILRVAPDRRLGLVILTNLDNAPLRRIAQTVMAEALGLPPVAPRRRKETAVPPEEMKAFVGGYRNRGSAEITVRDGRVTLILDGGPAMAVSRVGENRYLARPKPDIDGPEFVLQPATASAPAYLHFALWAYVR